MILRSIPLHPDLPAPSVPRYHTLPLRRNLRLREVFLLQSQRRRRRRRPQVSLRSALGDLFRDFISAFRAPASLELLLTPAFGLAAGAALYLSSFRKRFPDADAVVGEWVLFTSPTPFNRSVLLRCPSVSFEDEGELLQGLSERLLREERHYVNLNRGRIRLVRKEGRNGPHEEIQYQRVCLRTDDGGVISLDWPENLELRKEHGLDTTVLIVPGTVEGSMDRRVRSFVFDSLQHGYFPIVMNPRGCAGSPLTTPRLFTAADSDDVFTAVQFISSVRPWTTMMSIGWGYGANMLTKYLAEVGESTVLTAAVCIDNPFDLAEATRSFPHHIALDQNFTSGLVDILRANKELFQGKAKGFDVGRALSAKSLRDFDEAISVISHGYNTAEDFYSLNSTRKSIGSLKIPVLFIQSDDKTVPAFSMPSGSIAENPFTSLLLCSYSSSTIILDKISSIFWCHHLAIEWMSAVELALLKGRHPLLEDVDITINPSKTLAFNDEKAPEKTISSGLEGSHDSFQLSISRNITDGHILGKLAESNLVDEFLVDPLNSGLNKNHAALEGDINVNFGLRSELHKMENEDDERTKGEINDFDGKNDNETIDTSESDEESKVLQTAAVVMSVLDVSMPGTLDDEQKKKVLSAVGRGENLVRALQEAVPEDVRGRLTSAVTDILHTQGTKLNFEGISRTISWIPKVTEVSSSQETREEITLNEIGYLESKSGVGHDGRMQGDPEKLNSTSDRLKESSESSTLVNDLEQVGYRKEDTGGEQEKTNQSQEMVDRNTEDDEILYDAQHFCDGEGKISADKDEQNISILASGVPPSDQQVLQQESGESQKNEDKGSPDLLQIRQDTRVNGTQQHSTSEPPSISVTQALDALTGFDDSAQMAVNNVFGVLENMIDQLEKCSNEGDDDETKKQMDEKSQISSSALPTNRTDDHKWTEHKNNGSSECLNASVSSEDIDNILNEEATHSKEVDNILGDNMGSGNLKASPVTIGGGSEGNPVRLYSSMTDSITKVGRLQNYPLDVAINLRYWGSPYEAYIRRYLSSQLLKPKSSDWDSTTDLFLDPEKGQWKMVEQETKFDDNPKKGWQNPITHGYNENQHHSAKYSDIDNTIEPSYVILSSEFPELEQKSNENFGRKDGWNASKDDTLSSVRSVLLDALKVEVGRRLSTSSLMEIEWVIADDMKQVVDSITQAVVRQNQLNLQSFPKDNEPTLLKFGTLEAEQTVKTIFSAVEQTRYLKKVLPVGVIAGALLASLRKHFRIVTSRELNKVDERSENIQEQLSGKVVHFRNELIDKQRECTSDSFVGGDTSFSKENSVNDDVMIGAVTAALSATVLLARDQQKNTDSDSQVMEIPSSVTNVKGIQNEEHVRPEEAIRENDPISIVSNLAEKAMSVAGPVVPTKDDGEVDQERLVAILAELGQKSGQLKFVGKLALLWGGMRGAMSLTDKLISFLHIAEQPLLQRIIWFGCMALVLWSPVVVPFLPTLVQSWTMKTSNRFAQYICILGLYVSIMILVVLWGKRIRGFDNPLEQYGLDLTKSRALGFVKGLVGGMAIVMFVHSINGLLGYASVTWPPSLPSISQGSVLFLKPFISSLLLGFRGFITAMGIALAEELLFRSWLFEEVEADLGYYPAIMISGIAFSLIHGSLAAAPGFLLLSLALFGIKQRSQNKIYVPIGVRSGIMITSFSLQTGGLIRYKIDTPSWLFDTHALHPFDGVVGLSVCFLLAIVFFPKQPSRKMNS